MRLIQLGGATYQANLLAYLHEKNYNLDLICLDPYKDNPGHLFADISIYKSYTTLESTDIHPVIRLFHLLAQIILSISSYPAIWLVSG